MKRGIIYPTGRIIRTAEKDGISIEETIRKALHSKEPIEATAKISYSERKDGVLPQFDIRTDRFEYARTALDRVHASSAAARHAADFPEVTKDKDGNLQAPGEA